jgi:urea transporter
MSEEVNPVSATSLARVSREDGLAPFCGVGQIMFQNCAITGVFFLVGIAVASPLMALGAALGTVVGTLTAYMLRFDRTELRNGIYGFNGSLVGIALLFYHGPTALNFTLIAVGAALSSLVTLVMRSRVPFPTYTLPFIVTTWLMLFVCRQLDIPKTVPGSPPANLDVASAIVEGVSEVMFQANNLTGILFIVGILLCSWKGATWAVVGSLIGMLFALWHNDPISNITLGIYGYNAALAAMALALYRPSVLLPILAALISVPITELFPHLGLETLTTPFVLASWAVLAIDKLDILVHEMENATAK